MFQLLSGEPAARLHWGGSDLSAQQNMHGDQAMGIIYRSRT